MSSPLELAIAAYGSDLLISIEERRSIRALAASFDVSATTLTNRVMGRSTGRKEANAHKQKFTDGEEYALVAYIRRSDLSGHPLNIQTARETALAILTNRINSAPPTTPPSVPHIGYHWLERLLTRYPEVNSAFTRSIDTSRLKAVSLEQLAPWYAEMASLIDQYNHEAANIYNMDETGTALGDTMSTRVLTVIDRVDEGEEGGGKGKGKGKAWKAKPPRGEWITSIECVSATGRVLPPLVIFKGTSKFNEAWLPSGMRREDADIRGWAWWASASGWSNAFLGLRWLQDVFQPSTSTTERRLLIVDGHGSHVTPDFIGFCIDHLIDLMILPAHTSHVTQPLDVAVFGPLKTAMARETDLLARFN